MPHTLCAYVCRADFVVSSTLFMGPYRGSMSKLSLSLVVRHQHLARFVDLQPILIDRMTHLASKFRRALMREPERALPLLNEQLMVFAHGLESLYASGLQGVSFTSTFLYNGAFTVEFIAK